MSFRMKSWKLQFRKTHLPYISNIIFYFTLFISHFLHLCLSFFPFLSFNLFKYFYFRHFRLPMLAINTESMKTKLQKMLKIFLLCWTIFFFFFGSKRYYERSRTYAEWAKLFFFLCGIPSKTINLNVESDIETYQLNRDSMSTVREYGTVR